VTKTNLLDAGVKNAAWKTRNHTAGVENVGLDNPGPNFKAGKLGTGKHGNELVWN